MRMVIVEPRPGYTIRVTEEEARRKGWKPFEPSKNKKATPTAKKARKRQEDVEPAGEELES